MKRGDDSMCVYELFFDSAFCVFVRYVRRRETGAAIVQQVEKNTDCCYSSVSAGDASSESRLETCGSCFRPAIYSSSRMLTGLLACYTVRWL